ncbi:MAG: nucleotidyltransferase domain-containing protein [Candidatus Muirbacterium halophilum]|nr:nucleotidyltransferase domain-containing protein [Candidatus Muirbacterium halophilum]MCK9476745.1 nucleotidyltransferase domain-containing protein [Candidatus Muirbacterium halophilum]
MEYGIDEKIFENLENIFRKHSNISKVILYGSRAKGNYKNGSDIDITIIGENLKVDLLYSIMDDIDELNLIYKFDISIYSNIDNSDLIEHIDRVGKIIFQK